MLSRLTGNRVEVKSDRPQVKLMAAYDGDQKMLHALVWNFAVETPPACHVNLKIGGLQVGKLAFRRLALDSDTASNQENDRMRLQRNETLEDIVEARDSFDLPPYGIALVSLRRLE